MAAVFMKKLMLILVFLSSSAYADAELICYYRFEDRFINMMDEDYVTCSADAVWGKDNVCFNGSVADMVTIINEETIKGLDDLSRGIRAYDAKVVDNDSFGFTGVDYLMRAYRVLRRCTE